VRGQSLSRGWFFVVHPLNTLIAVCVFVRSGQTGDSYAAALLVASAAGLDTDTVHQAHWRALPPTTTPVATLLATLAAVRDAEWVVAQALACAAPDAAVARALVAAASSRVSALPNAPARRTARQRLRARRATLRTFEAVAAALPPTLAMAPLPVWLLQSPLRRAFQFAVRGAAAALVLTVRHAAGALAPHVLTLLAALPETVPPATVAKLLPAVTPAGDAVVPLAAATWPASDDDEVDDNNDKRGDPAEPAAAVPEDQAEEDDGRWLAAELAGLDAASVPALDPTRVADVQAWYLARAVAVARAGLPLLAFELLAHGTAAGVPGLAALEADMRALVALVYECGFHELSWPAFAALPPAARIDAALRGLSMASPAAFAADVRRCVLPLLGHPPRAADLAAALVRLAAEPAGLDRVLAVVAATPPLLADADALAAGALDAAYACTDVRGRTRAVG
jgi:hypothetical protein